MFKDSDLNPFVRTRDSDSDAKDSDSNPEDSDSDLLPGKGQPSFQEGRVHHSSCLLIALSVCLLFIALSV